MTDYEEARRQRLLRWTRDWLPALESGCALSEVSEDASFAYLIRGVGHDGRRLLGEHFRGRRVLVLGQPSVIKHAGERFFVGGATPEIESIHKAATWPPGLAIYGDAEALVIETSFGDNTKRFKRLKSHAHHFPGPVVTVGHFLFESFSRPPKEASSALRLHGQKPPNVRVVWQPPAENIRQSFEQFGLA